MVTIIFSWNFMWSNIALKNVCGNIKHCENDFKIAFISVFEYDCFECFIRTEAGVERREVLAKNKLTKTNTKLVTELEVRKWHGWRVVLLKIKEGYPEMKLLSPEL